MRRVLIFVVAVALLFIVSIPSTLAGPPPNPELKGVVWGNIGDEVPIRILVISLYGRWSTTIKAYSNIYSLNIPMYTNTCHLIVVEVKGKTFLRLAKTKGNTLEECFTYIWQIDNTASNICCQ